MSLYSKIFASKKLVIFDLDGTLVNTLTIHTNVLVEAFQEKGKISSPNQKTIFKHYGKSAPLFIQSVLQDHGVPHTETNIQEIIDYHSHEMNNGKNTMSDDHILHGVRPLLTRLKKDEIHCVVASGNTRKTGESILKSTGINHYFETTGFSTDSLHGKKIVKRSQILEKVLEEMKMKDDSITLENRLCVGDTLNDVEAAREIEMTCLLVETGGLQKNDIPPSENTYFVSTLEECLK